MRMRAKARRKAKVHAAGNRRETLTIDSRNEDREGMSVMFLGIYRNSAYRKIIVPIVVIVAIKTIGTILNRRKCYFTVIR